MQYKFDFSLLKPLNIPSLPWREPAQFHTFATVEKYLKEIPFLFAGRKKKELINFKFGLERVLFEILI